MIKNPIIKNLIEKIRQDNSISYEMSYEEKIKYNQEHLPSLKIPMENPPYEKLDEFIEETRFKFWEYDISYKYMKNNEKITLCKSELDADLVKFISILKEDMDWLDSHSLGESIGEDSLVVRNFLKNKYGGLSEDSLRRLLVRYCHNNM